MAYKEKGTGSRLLYFNPQFKDADSDKPIVKDLNECPFGFKSETTGVCDYCVHNSKCKLVS